MAVDLELIFGDVFICANPDNKLSINIDTDDGNIAHLQTSAQCLLKEFKTRTKPRKKIIEIHVIKTL